MWSSAFATALLLLGPVSAGIIGGAGLLVRRDGAEQEMRRYVDSMVDSIEPRQPTTQSTTPPPINLTIWDLQTMAACSTALTALKGNVGNPSGMAACYNLPFLDNSTGVFQADLRLFTVSAPSGSFANIPSQNVMVGLSYVGATVSVVNSSSLGRRDNVLSLDSWPRSEDGVMRKRQTTAPVMAQSYAFVGQINKDLMSPNMDR